MKTERRHELQTNTLAQHLAEGIEKVKPYINHILLGIAAVVVVMVAMAVFKGQSKAKQASAWEAYFVATTDAPTSSKTEQERLREVATMFSDTEMAEWAKLAIADQSAQQAARLINSNKSEARSNLNEAIAEYQPLAEKGSVQAVRNLANYNLGLSYEMLGDLDKAVTYYGKAGGAMREVAKSRIEDLKKDDIKDFYDWYAKAEPQRLVPPEGGIPGQTPAFEADEPAVSPFGNLPGNISDPAGDDQSPIELFPKSSGTKTPTDDLGLPSLEGGTIPVNPAPEKPGEAGTDEKPGTEEKPAAEESPAPAEKPAAAEKPAGDEPPAEKTPEAPPEE